MTALNNWLISLSPWQNILLALGIIIFMFTGVAMICTWCWRDEGMRVNTMPTEADLREREQKASREAYLKYTRPRKVV